MTWLASHPLLEVLIVGLLLVVDGVFGAWISTNVRSQNFGWYATLLSGNFTIIVWTYLTRWSKMELALAAVFFDLIYNAAWFLALVYFGQSMNRVQAIGIVLVVVGLAFLGYRKN